MIPFNKPYYPQNGIKYVKDTFKRRKISGDGYYSKRISKFIEEKFGVKKALFVTSGSAALDMAAIILDLQPQDEVIMPSYTFVSTANSVMLRNAKVIFVDIDPKTMNIDPIEIEKFITPNTKALFVVHYAGISCDMGKIMDIAKKYNIKVIEDAAQGVNSKYKDKYLGSIGDIGCYSFHETKNYVCGEGGAFLLNDESLIERAEIIWEKGTNRRKFFRGEVDKYSWIDIGSSFLGSDMLAAFLYAQFEALEKINFLRKNVFEYYYELLEPLEKQNFLKLPFIPNNCTPNYHMFYIILKNNYERDEMMNFLKNSGIHAIFHYIPLHSSPMGRKLGYKSEDLPLTEEYAGRLLRLPMYAELKKREIEYIVQKISKMMKLLQPRNIDNI
nr:dTDP-4-amino-4,6-dideoxygalactose transaminase [Candidatus Prometheoarchaeum syntrophicum]